MAPNAESVDLKNKRVAMALLHKEKDHYNHEDKRNNEGAEGRHSSEPEKAHPTVVLEFNICHLETI